MGTLRSESVQGVKDCSKKTKEYSRGESSELALEPLAGN